MLQIPELACPCKFLQVFAHDLILTLILNLPSKGSGISFSPIFILSPVFNFYLFFKNFIYFCLRWVFLLHGLSLVAMSGATLPCSAWTSHCGGFSCYGARALGVQASVVVAHRLSSVVHRLSCSAACGIFPDQGSNPCPLHWQVDSTTEPPGKSLSPIF